MVHGIAAGNMTNKLAVSDARNSATYSSVDPMTFVKNGFEQVSFNTSMQGISLARFISGLGITLNSGDTVSFTGQASSIAKAENETIGNYYITLNENASTNELDKAAPFLLVHKSTGGVEKITMSGITIAAASSTDSEDSGSGSGGGGAVDGYVSPTIPREELVVDAQETEGDKCNFCENNHSDHG